jgi:hypothetical protein
VSVQPSAARRIADELRGLYEAAGRPDYATLVRQGARQTPTVAISDSTLSDWFNGRSVPSEAKSRHLRFLVEFLEGRAKQLTDYIARGALWWEQLRGVAWEETHANRRGRPRTRPAAADGVPLLGRMIGALDESDALLLEVHEAITADGADLPVLPPYLPRAHDDLLRRELVQAEQGSRVVMLVGGSTTGKTRAAWEAIRAVLPSWRLWHPLIPERPQAVVEALVVGRVAPRTVIWLNEAQMYLRPTGTGARVATALQQLLHDPATAPVLVLGSMWPEYWTELTDPQSTEHAAVRALLGRAREIPVPSEFTEEDIIRLRGQIVSDPRLRVATEQGGGRVTQHLAGVPELIRRYKRASDHVRAVVRAAMDARRLSRWLHLPHEFLYRAAPGYLDPQVWDQTDDGDAWFEDALAYLTEPCRGAPGPLRRRRALPGDTDSLGGYRLADYLEQVGRAERACSSPPASFWDAVAATCADPAVLSDLAYAAYVRGRLHRARQLYRRAACCGDTGALRDLARLREKAGDHAEADVIAREAADRGDTEVLRDLAWLREKAGDHAGADAKARETADHGNTRALRDLAGLRKQAGDHAEAERLYREAASRGDTEALQDLAWLREQTGDHADAERLYREVADRGRPAALRGLARLREKAGDHAGADAAAQEAADRGHPEALLDLARRRERAGDHAGADAAIQEAADPEDAAEALLGLARRLEQAGDHAAAETLYREAPVRGDFKVLMDLVELREHAGDHAGAVAAAREAADRGHPYVLINLAGLREKAGDHAQAEMLYWEAANRGYPDALRSLVGLREQTGDRAGADAAAREAADRGDTNVLMNLALRREHAGDHADAKRLYREAADRGDSTALMILALWQEHVGDHVRAATLYWKAADCGHPHALQSLIGLREAGRRPRRCGMATPGGADRRRAVPRAVAAKRASRASTRLSRRQYRLCLSPPSAQTSVAAS